MTALPSFSLPITGGNAGPSRAEQFGNTIAPVTVVGANDPSSEMATIFSGQSSLIRATQNINNVAPSVLGLGNSNAPRSGAGILDFLNPQTGGISLPVVAIIAVGIWFILR